MRVFINLVAFQIGWFAAVLGAGQGMPWLGVAIIPMVVLLNLFLSVNWRQDLSITFAAAIIGFIVDTTLVSAGIFAPVPFLFPLPFSPLWMVLLWVNLVNAFNVSMAWLRGRYLAGALFGAVGGPLAYVSGAKLGAAIPPSTSGIAILAITWAVVFPALLAVNEFVRKWLAARAAKEEHSVYS